MGGKVRSVFVSGNFNTFHAGHSRLLNFARQLGSKLIVGVICDDLAKSAVSVSETERIASLKSQNIADEVLLLTEDIQKTILTLKPDIVVKGKEFEFEENPEEHAVKQYGGLLLFGSSEIPLTSLNSLNRDSGEGYYPSVKIPKPYSNLHELNLDSLRRQVDYLERARVCVLGDLIVDEYVTCEALGMSQEDATLVVTPLDTRQFLGGAGIVAAHAASFGAKSTLITVVGNDNEGSYARNELASYGVKLLDVSQDGRPTTLKQRFRSNQKTLLKVSHLNQAALPKWLQDRLFQNVEAVIDDHDVLIFSDFNYGCLPQALVDQVASLARSKGIIMVADSQSSSQLGDISRFRGMHLISATEREARISMRDSTGGLVVLAEKLRYASDSENVLLKLGGDGVLVHTRENLGNATSHIPALNQQPVDVAGAGDSMLITTAVALATGASLGEAAALGSVAAGIQVSRIGNQPISKAALKLAVM